MQPLTSYGVGAFVRNRWGALKVEAVNSTDEAKELEVAAYHEGSAQDQYGKRIWVPARSRLRTWFPFFASHEEPEQRQQDPMNAGRSPDVSEPGISVAPPNEGHLEIRSWVTDITDGQDSVIRAQTGEMQMESVIQIAPREVSSGIMHTNPSWGPEQRNMPYEAFVALRVGAKQSRRMSTVTPDTLPADPNVLATFDSLVIANDDVLSQTGMTEALQAWLLKGGHMWLMLDAVSAETAQQLIGNAAILEEIDETSLPTFQLVAVGSPQATGTLHAFDDPVRMKRVSVDGADVKLAVDGWPALFWVPIGRGKIMVTTIEPRGWVRRFTGEDIRPGMSSRSAVDTFQAAAYQSDFVIIDEMQGEAEAFFSRALWPESQPRVINEYLTEQIGHSVPQRTVIGGVLLGFCGLLAVAGVALLRADRAAWLLVVSPGLALLAAGILGGLGYLNRSQTPSTLAQFQVVRAVNGNPIVDIDSKGALFASSSGPRTFVSQDENLMILKRGSSSQEIRRMLWNDMNEWTLSNVNLPVGQTYLEQSAIDVLPEPVSVRATFNDQGLEGTLTMPGVVEPAEGVLVFEHQFAPVRFDETLGWQVLANREFSRGQFVDADVLNDTQARRQEFYRELFLQQGQWEITQPVLYFWDQPRRVPMSTEDLERQSGASLNMVPVEFESPEPNTVVDIPQSLLRIRSGADPQGERPSGLYSWRSGEWLDKKDNNEYYLRLEVPKALMPLRLEEVQVQLRFDVGNRQVELLGVEDGAPRVLRTLRSPRELVELKFDDPQLLKLNQLNEWVFGFRISLLPDVEPEEFWSVQDLRIRMRGTANVTGSEAN